VPCQIRRFADQRFTVWRCTNCGSLHSAEAADLPLFYQHYPLQQNRLTFQMRVGLQRRLRLLERHGMNRSDKILDYGCGVGLFLDVMKQNGYLNARGYDAYVPGYGDAGLLTRSEYDVVCSYDVIEHLDDPREFMAAIVPLVRPGGLLFISTPNADHISLAGRGGYQFELSQPYHRHILSESMLIALGSEWGLRVQTVLRRCDVDTLVPGVNTQFMFSYMEDAGGLLDVAFERPRIGLIAKSPRLLFYAFFGYFVPRRSNLAVAFRRESQRSVPAAFA
jgi:2-polyprenyl-3-methyl-5-hydroxy-6-metoxy-1,4-benzoquinol methylase